MKHLSRVFPLSVPSLSCAALSSADVVVARVSLRGSSPHVGTAVQSDDPHTDVWQLDLVTNSSGYL